MKRYTLLLMFLIAALVLVACTGADESSEPAAQPTEETAAEVEEPSDEAVEEVEEPTEEPSEDVAEEATEPEEETAALPGEGVTVSVGRPTWDTEWFQAEVFRLLLQELGYTVEKAKTMDNPVFYLSAAQGDVDFWASGWFPLHTTFLEDEKVKGKVERIGFEAKGGALQGYLVDKKTAEEHGITNLEDLKDPEIAALFDSDDNGKANLMGCDPGWGCELVIEHHLDAFELRDTVEHVQGSYSALMADTFARVQRGEPVLWYTWTPNWTVGMMKPGEDVVWIETPFYSSPEEQEADDATGTVEGVVGCVEDPCEMGWPPNDIRVVANKEFLEQNPAAKALFEQVEIDVASIFAQNALMYEGEEGEEDIQRHAADWIAENRDQVDEWLAIAIEAAE